MAVTLGSGKFRYDVAADWAKLPDGWEFRDVAAVAVDSKDRVYVFNRGEHPMMVFDREGNFLRSWGEGVFHRAHGVHLGPDETLYCTDDGDHTVRKCTLEGKVLLEIGIPEQAGAVHERRAVQPLHAHRALAARRHLRLGRLRQRARPQVFARRQAAAVLGRTAAPIRVSSTSRTTSAATRMAGSTSPTARTIASRSSTATASTRPSGTTCTVRAASTCEPRRHPVCYIGELGPTMPVNRQVPNLGPRISIVDARRQAAGAPGRHPRRPAPRPVHRAAWHGGGLARRHLRRRGVLYRLVAGVSRHSDARGTAQPAQADPGWLMQTASPQHRRHAACGAEETAAPGVRLRRRRRRGRAGAPPQRSRLRRHHPPAPPAERNDHTRSIGRAVRRAAARTGADRANRAWPGCCGRGAKRSRRVPPRRPARCTP